MMQCEVKVRAACARPWLHDAAAALSCQGRASLDHSSGFSARLLRGMGGGGQPSCCRLMSATIGALRGQLKDHAHQQTLVIEPWKIRSSKAGTPDKLHSLVSMHFGFTGGAWAVLQPGARHLGSPTMWMLAGHPAAVMSCSSGSSGPLCTVPAHDHPYVSAGPSLRPML